jgi:hypothetical protein
LTLVTAPIINAVDDPTRSPANRLLIATRPMLTPSATS